MSEQQGPQNSIQFIAMLVKAFVTGIPKMIKSIIVAAAISGVFTLGLHFYLLLFPNDGYNSSGNPILDSILVLANVNPTPPNVLLFWFLLNFLFWWVVGVFREKGILGGVKQFATTPLFVANSLREAGLGAFPMLMAGLAFAFLMRLAILGTMTTLQMFLMSIGILVSQADSIVLIGLQLGFKDVKGLVSRGQQVQTPSTALPATMVLGAILGFAYLVYFPFNPVMVQALVVLMILGLLVLFVRGRRSSGLNSLAMVLMLLCVFAVAAQPVLADDGGAAESGGAGNVINNPTLRDFMIRQGINPALAGIAASLFAQGKLTKGLFDKLKSGKLDYSGLSNREFDTMRGIRTQLLTNLQHMEHEIWFGKAEKLWKESGSPGDVRKHIDKLIDDIIHGREVDLNHYGRVYTVYTGHITGRTITEGMIPTDAQLNREIFENTLNWSTRTLVTGRDINGNLSWIGMGTRIGVGIWTGGASEFVWAPANSLYTMKDYVDAGETSTLKIFAKTAAWTAFEELVIGNGIQYGVGKLGGVVGKFGKYIDDTYPGAAGKFRNALNKIDDTLHKDVTDLWSSKPKPGLPRGSQFKSPSDIIDDINRIKSSGQKLPGVDDVRIGQRTPTGEVEMDFSKMKPLDGDPHMVPRDVKGFQEAAEMNDAIIVVRKGNEAGLDVIASKQAHPKSMEIKAKSIDEYDRLLGFDDAPAIQGRGTNEGLVGCKKPKLPDNFESLDPATQSNVMRRYSERMDEFTNLEPELNQMRDAGKIEWDPESGIIRNAKDGKPYAGDNDPFMYLDPDTGQPLNPYRTNTVNRQLQQNGQTLHNDHMNWDYNNYQTSNPGKFNQYQGIDNKILSGHQNGKLMAYNPRTKKWYELAWDGEPTRNWEPWQIAGGK